MVVMVMLGAGGSFSAEVPLDQSGHECPATLFDGSDVVVDVSVGGTTVVDGGAIRQREYVHALAPLLRRIAVALRDRDPCGHAADARSLAR